MAISEIEKLERRYTENPHGLTFAPLAEIHRKNGDVARALELLAPGLALHPDYIPASIVLGRCHLDLGDQHAAEAAFTHVLSLDSENVIALKALADITERLLRLDDSERWLVTLLSVDRSNDDARDQLERVRAFRRQAEVASSAAPGAGTEETGTLPGLEPVEHLRVEPFAANIEVAAESATPSSPPSPVEGEAHVEPDWGRVSDTPSGEEAVPLAFEDLESEAAPATETVEPLSGLVGRNVEEVAAEIAPYGEDSDGFQVEMSEDIVLQSSGASEFQMPNAADELIDARTPPPAVHQEPAQAQAQVEEPEPVSQTEPEPMAATAAEPVPAERAESAPAEPTESEPASVSEPVRATIPEPMVTETMAELLASQGHHEEALSVYRELEVRTGGDSRLQQRIADLEEIRPAAQRQRFAAADTGGQSVGDFLRGVLAARPPAQAGAQSHAEAGRTGPAAANNGAPTRPAHDALSLSSVFGEEGTPTRPAVPAAGSTAAGGVSFDEFFNTPTQGSSRKQLRTSEARTDDLDQFHTWLQNLKR